MLPSSGYFQSINCPFYDSGLCDRSYCHYRHVKRDNPTKECGSAEVGANSLLGVGDDHNILQQLVSEAVKKALRDTELSSSVEGDAGNAGSSGGTEEVSSKLAEKVIEGLKPLVARSPPSLPTPVVSVPIPSYKPTPISELRKRHIPVPYTPKDAKTTLIKRQSSTDVGSQLVKAKPVSTKRREEYVPGNLGKAVDGEKPCYKPYTPQSYGEVHYSPLDSAVTSEILYTPSDKSSLPTKTPDYVPTGLSDTSLPNAFYKPTNRGDSPIREPEYQPYIGSSSSRLLSYIPSKLDGSKENSDVDSSSDAFDPECSTVSYSSSKISQGCVKKNINESHIKQLSSTKHPVTNVPVKLNSDNATETHSATSKGSNSDSSHSNSVKLKSKSESKERDKLKSSSKYSSHHKSQQEHKSGKGHSSSREHKDGKVLKDLKHQKENKDHKESKSPKDSKNHKSMKDGHTALDTNNSKDEFHEKDNSIHKSIKGSKDSKDKHKRRNEDEHDSKVKRQRLDSSDGVDGKKKEKARETGSKTENKHKSESSRSKSDKEKKSINDKHSSSRTKHSGSSHAVHKTIVKHTSESVEMKESRNKLNSSVKKSKTSASGQSNNKKFEENKTVPKTSIVDLKRKHHSGDSFEEMESLIMERLQERDHADLSVGDSDTDEDIRAEECLKIFNSYKPEAPEETHKKTELSEKEPEGTDSALPAKKRLAHEGAAFLAKKTVVPRKLFDPALAMVNRLTKAKEQLPEVQLLQPKTIPGKRRIAHVPNVSKLLDAKEKIIAEVQSAKSEPTKSQTIAKGSQRVAHVPPKEVTCRPLISSVDGSKIPANVRQKYCNLMFDELLKKMESEEDCCRLALMEEESCYSRSSSRNVYVNLAIITIQRLRNLAVTEGKDVTSGGSKITVRHENVIGGKSKAQGLWSIIPSKKGPAVLDESLAYQLMMEKYVMAEDELVANGYPRPCPTEKGRAIMMETTFRGKSKSKSFTERICDRCGKEYFVDEKGLGNPSDNCTFHWGRAFKTRGIGELETRYSCCQGEARSEGCTMWACHVSDMFDPDNLRGFVQTLEKPNATPGKIFALDCEMCYTTGGLELARVTIINYKGECVYDSLVKPEKTVLDYVTRYSGLDEAIMKKAKRTILDIQATLLSLFDKKTILIGHSLDSDLKALKLIHDTVVDTSLVFPHRRGPPLKRALKTLCAEYLQQLIQTGEAGHDSAEDALACIDLMKWKLKEDLKSR
ncbi:RNA exonuclease 1 homolog isoform X2 [Hetaerina americana]|uniref:RNA exonuclease 1 homolog isoform X2 n=1 Tax=Hetaerina americana TaxID=62018 RepID=UPI003A7F16AF